MKKVFDFDKLDNHDLYHLRYGRGAVIVAIPTENSEQQEASWNATQNEIHDASRKRAKEIKLQLVELDKSRITFGTTEEIRENSRYIDSKKQILQEKLRAIAYQKKRYFTNLQLAQFYTHNIPAQHEVCTRFDRIVRIEELDYLVRVVLSFEDRTGTDHWYHTKIGINAGTGQVRRSSHVIVGQVERLMPKDSVTLEFVRQAT